MSAPRWITEAEVVAALDLPRAIDALARTLVLEAHGTAATMVKTVASWGGGDTLHALGAAVPGAGVVGTKTWAHTEGGATPLLVLYDAHDGALLAIVEAFALGQLRTAGISAVATRALALPDASELAILGTGKQSLAQVAAVAAVRPLRRVRVWSPNPEHRASFAQRVRETLGVETVDAASVRDAVDGAHVITAATRATAPFIDAAMPSRGAHLNALGAIVPSRAEFEPALLARCAVVAADSVEQTRALSREFRDFYEPGGWAAVRPLSSLLAEGAERPAGADLTLFKAMGIGLSDLALGIALLDLARERSLGRELPAPRRAALDFSHLAVPAQVS
ncbi:ornithine cyclodeaminase [Vulcanimicrobium alpinum]|uniref:Ornithine cyclodeaminase n=1 Tax=Vulcanimicrobium alpinum TaxID=3016050 RepID=A0AAN1XZZ9_UNVUL|nr:hypothetical protein [Vulcanimicrobium alpinum]BDE07402.1 ornithine cyclodeaminase [Vulcanimicrobium alpinum]